MDVNKAVKIRLLDVKRPEMRAFHLSWTAFFLCFFGWFGVAPLMAVIRDELSLTKEQIGNTIVASVAITVLARVCIGGLLDRYGPRRVYTGLLAAGAIPVMGIGLANSYETFLSCRLAIGAIGASFVVTQYHTSLVFAPNCVGTANATTAGWGNAGGGATQMLMPVIMGAFLLCGFSTGASWRLALIVPGVAMLLMAAAYHRFTRDTLEGDLVDLRRRGVLPDKPTTARRGLLDVARDIRVWALFVIYGACFGIELTINNVAALYFVDQFEVGLAAAGVIAGLYGLMNVFSRTLGGFASDRVGARMGLRGRVVLLGVVLFLEGIALMAFSRMTSLGPAIVMLVVFSLFVQMSSGATFSIVPFVNKRALGPVAGVVGAGGNVGAVAAGFLFRSEAIETRSALLYLGGAVTLCALLTLVVRFSALAEHEARREREERLREAELVPAE